MTQCSRFQELEIGSKRQECARHTPCFETNNNRSYLHMTHRIPGRSQNAANPEPDSSVLVKQSVR
jgi:hypothetical protein